MLIFYFKRIEHLFLFSSTLNSKFDQNIKNMHSHVQDYTFNFFVIMSDYIHITFQSHYFLNFFLVIFGSFERNKKWKENGKKLLINRFISLTIFENFLLFPSSIISKNKLRLQTRNFLIKNQEWEHNFLHCSLLIEIDTNIFVHFNKHTTPTSLP